MKVLDASALLSFLEKQKGYEVVKDALTRAANLEKPLLMTSVNWGEVYYILLRNYPAKASAEVLLLIDSCPIEIIDVDQEIAGHAASFKAAKKLSYVDGFAAALAKIKKSALITADKEFEAVKDDIDIVWV